MGLIIGVKIGVMLVIGFLIGFKIVLFIVVGILLIIKMLKWILIDNQKENKFGVEHLQKKCETKKDNET